MNEIALQSDVKPPPRRSSVVVQLTVLVAATLTVLLGGLAVVSHLEGRRLVRRMIDERLAAVAASRRAYMVEWLGRQQDHMTVFSTRGVLRNYLEKMVSGQPLEPQQTQAQDNLSGHVSSGQALRASLVSREGRVLMSSEAAEVGRDLADDPVFQGGLKKATVGVPRRAGEKFVADLAAPSRWVDGTRAVLGVVMLTVNATPLADSLGDRTGLGETGEVLLGVQQNGELRFVFPPRFSVRSDRLPPADAPAMALATAGRKYFGYNLDYRREPVLAAGLPVGPAGWGLVAKMDEREAYAPIVEARRRTLLLALGTGAVGLAVAYSVARFFTRPIRRLAAAAGAVTRGELDVSVPVRSGNELGALSEAFNAMTAALLARTSERERAEEAVRQSEELLRSIVEHTEDSIFVKDRESRTIFKNPAGLRVNALPAEKVLGHSDAEFAPDAAQAEQFLATDRRVMETRETMTVEEVLTSATGEKHVLLTTKTPRYDAAGEVIGLVGVSHDITAQKAAEENLRESNARYELVVTGTAAGIWDWDVLARRVYYSPRWVEMRGYAPGEISDREEEWNSRIHPDDMTRVIGALRAHIAGETPVFAEEYRIRCKDGSWKWVLDRGVARRDESGRAVRVAGSEIDITERKQAEEKLKASLHEKEVLLREVHHRVKNNLQIVSSLLNLQCRQLTDPEQVKIFASTRDRVRAMAAVHERLYESGDFAQIDLAAHLGALVRALTRAYLPAGFRLQSEVRLVPMTVDLNTAVPLSLIANELIINALKYACAGRTTGVMRVELHACDGSGELRVSDDGPGFATTIDPAAPRTLGLRLVRDLARQIRGELEIDSTASGANIAIRWPARPAASEPTASADEAGAS